VTAATFTPPKDANRRIWAIAGPAIIANSSTPLVGLVDTWVIGHMPEASHLAAVGVGATLFSFLFWSVGFLRMSTTGLVAQAHGRENTSEVADTLVRSATLGLLLAGVLLILQPVVFWLGMMALTPPGTIQPLIADYFYVRIWAAPATLFIYSLSGYLLGTAQAKAALYVQLVLNLFNAALNLILVLGLGLGVTGIALGSVFAEWIAALFGLYLLGKKLGFALIGTSIRRSSTFALTELKKLLSANGYIFARTLLLMTALALVTRQAATLGEAPLAANQVLMTFLMLIALGLDAFAHAAEAYVGSAYGKASIAEMRFWVARTNLWAGAVALLYSAAFYLFGNALIDTLTNIEPVRVQAKTASLVMALMPILSVWCYQYDGIFVGATSGRGMLYTMIAAFACYLLVLGPLTVSWGFMGLWTAVLVFMSARGLAQILYYPRIERRIRQTG
jgi:MATE family multidrug resistance protein